MKSVYAGFGGDERSLWVIRHLTMNGQIMKVDWARVCLIEAVTGGSIENNVVRLAFFREVINKSEYSHLNRIIETKRIRSKWNERGSCLISKTAKIVLKDKTLRLKEYLIRKDKNQIKVLLPTLHVTTFLLLQDLLKILQ